MPRFRRFPHAHQVRHARMLGLEDCDAVPDVPMAGLLALACAAGVPISELAGRLSMTREQVLSARPEGPIAIALAVLVGEAVEAAAERHRGLAGHPTPLWERDGRSEPTLPRNLTPKPKT